MLEVDLLWEPEPETDASPTQQNFGRRSLRRHAVQKEGPRWIANSWGAGYGVVSLNGNVGVKEVYVFVDPANPSQTVWLKDALLDAAESPAASTPEARGRNALRRPQHDPGRPRRFRRSLSVAVLCCAVLGLRCAALRPWHELALERDALSPAVRAG